ncbi:hypothetical protein BDN70DRAFT_874567 [Pholiota conissans]|uniref:DUF4211 domain-containing protein n=1 Tax=Pholiota conissans TaxID=109636 RepID=A0A9P6D4M6_9AGAR|nr:hypothetical protein BDN70DRAFT_874567 [Pholiota conissans]
MPSSRRKKNDSPTRLRQTTLFDNLASFSAPSKQKCAIGRNLTSSQPSKEKKADFQEEDSSDELVGITFEDSPTSRDSPPMPRPNESEVASSLPANASHDSGPQSSNTNNLSEPPPKKRRLHRRKTPEIVASGDEDVLLADEVDKDMILETRLRTRGKSKYQKNLERLKRRKLKLPDEESGAEPESEQSDEELTRPSRLFEGSKPSRNSKHDTNSSDNEELTSENSSDFIVEDDNAIQLPPEFSMETHQDLSHQFKKIYQFFVHIAVQPGKKRAAYMQKQLQDEQYFSIPLQVLRRKLSGLRDSLVSSSIWRPEFKSSLEKYPEFELTRLDFAVPSCDACHLGGRLSTLMGRLNGRRYDSCGFEVKPKNNEEEDGKEFYLGRFCAKRTKVFHEFSHWEYDLFQSIVREINQLRMGISSKGFYRIAYAGGKPPKDLDDADGLCDWLDKRKLIDMEWQRLKFMMESARHLEMEKEDIPD